MANNETLNTYIHEKVLGLCWHRWNESRLINGMAGDIYYCALCKEQIKRGAWPDYTTSDGMRLLVGALIEKKGWKYIETAGVHSWPYYIVHSKQFALDIAVENRFKSQA